MTEYDLKNCRLLNAQTNEVLAVFDARAISDRELRGGFVGGLATGTHAMTIGTLAKLDVTPYNNAVVIDDVRFIVTARRLNKKKALGEVFVERNRAELILVLE